jgi:rubrerythrin
MQNESSEQSGGATERCKKCSEAIESGQRRLPDKNGAVHENCVLLIHEWQTFECDDCGYRSKNEQFVRACPACGSARTRAAHDTKTEDGVTYYV